MSWATHDVEPYVIKRHLEWFERRIGFPLSFTAILIGSWGPDLFTKWIVYGVKLGGYEIKASNPAKFHRGFPGVGFTHSLAFGIALGLLFYLCSNRGRWAKGWAIGLAIGIWAHVLSDTLDTNGVMLFFPFSFERVSFGAWEYAGETGRFIDGAAYFSSLGFVWDAFWIGMVLVNYRTLDGAYFREHVLPDPFYRFLHGRLHLPADALVVLYRGAFFFGVCRWIAWLTWAHVANDNSFDLSWGGPGWVPPFEAIVPFSPGH